MERWLELGAEPNTLRVHTRVQDEPLDALLVNRHQHLHTTQAEPSVSPELQLSSMILRHVRYVLELNRGNKRKTAQQLGISRSTLYRLISEANHAQ